MASVAEIYGTPQVHDFEESLRLSQSYANAPWWALVYRAAFPTFETMAYVNHDGWAQRAGIDRVIGLASSKQVLIDEKVREKHYEDVFLEYWSNYEREVRGWIALDSATDYIAYAFAPTQRCLLLPFHLLRRAWMTHHTLWVQKYLPRKVRNNGYTTVGVPVPIQVLFDALNEAADIRWSLAPPAAVKQPYPSRGLPF